ncbi:MAG: thioredoxin [Syntrophales bacterium]|jgi:thioredoxin 1|nr:thioredoxin [Syntrophales bacterium]MDY0043128.1 thioredoxin domain-containing protein [Syntrophales bacterium]
MLGNDRQPLHNRPNHPVIITDENIDEAVMKYPFLIIDCWAGWCAPCKKIEPMIEELASDQDGDIVFGTLHVDTNPKTSARYNIQFIPDLLVFKKGNKVGDIIGAMSKEILLEKINLYK